VGKNWGDASRDICIRADRRNEREGVEVGGGNVLASGCDGRRFRLICSAVVDIGRGGFVRRC
jgi:hypothetical protein